MCTVVQVCLQNHLKKGFFLSNMHKRIIIIRMQSFIGNWYLKNWLQHFSKCNSAPHYFPKCNSAPHYFSKCNSEPHYFSKCEVSASLFFLSVSQRAIEFSFQKHYSAIASIS